ncbi:MULTISPECIES: response regulator [Maridesulfovibrio]|jgi:DNA-binding NtrC family response regulator|uniref:Response regulator receiver protein n=1 Tax=Maridesulfovibrio salexigens (strain ATCC 14822 / DSM 2638 / NCIMB 8403 / VKM B-1763) TaxID=526222 RepID=C6C136_MARSD|nr:MULTISPECIES: response regulator [Maridesulfovibrio]ACS79199.1 response regulator receiver protein [Maridesulfovibrio salexigens DSM 2638]
MAEKVLLVDDEKEFVEGLAERMELRGMNVTACTNPQEALDKVDSETFDAIVLDLQMPGIDGIEALKHIRKSRPEMQVILLSGHATVEKGIEAMKLGAMDFVEKPADINVLTDKIKKAQAKKMILVEEKTEEKVKDILSHKGW